MRENKDIKKERRRFEDELRKNLLNLLSKGLEDEAEDLIFRLRKKAQAVLDGKRKQGRQE